MSVSDDPPWRTRRAEISSREAEQRVGSAGSVVGDAPSVNFRFDHHVRVTIAVRSRPVSTADITWLNTAETARRLGVTPLTLYRFIYDGQFPAYRKHGIPPTNHRQVPAERAAAAFHSLAESSGLVQPYCRVRRATRGTEKANRHQCP